MNREELRNAFLAAGQNNGKMDLSDEHFNDASFAAVVRELPPLPFLTELNLSRTHIGGGGLSEVTRLDSLQTLYLRGCGLVTNDDLAHLQGLRALQKLYLGYCKQITDAGLAHLKGLNSLQTLYLGGKQITNEGLAHLEGLNSLQTLYLGGCEKITNEGLAHLQGLRALQTLYLSYCKQITEAGLAHLKDLNSLQTLYLRGTGVKSVLPEVLDTLDAQEILKAILAGVALHHVRIALVGMGGVGKTCLFRRLFLGEIVNRGEEHRTTHDIDLTRREQVKWKPTVRFREDDAGTTIEPRVWDFGGQLVLHGVHESFFAPDNRTIYILVLAADRVPQRATHAEHGEMGNGLDYWLRTISGFAGTEAPIIVAITKCDEYGAGARRKIDEPLVEKPQSAEDGHPLAEWFPDRLSKRIDSAVCAIVDGCSATDEKMSIEPLRQAIEAAAATLSAIREQKVAPEFIDLMRRVEQEMEQRSLTTVDEYRQWCREVNIEEAVGQDAYLRVLHSLGVVFYFGRTPTEEAEYERQRRIADEPTKWADDYPPGQHRVLHAEVKPMLKKYVINPAWLKRPLYGVIRQSELKETRDNDGWIERQRIKEAVRTVESELSSVLRHEFPAHPDAEAVFFDALDRMELCYFDGEKQSYFFPRGLDDKATAYLPEWAKKDTASYGPTDCCRLNWAFLRESAIHRLIVHWFPQRADRKIWRYGMVAENERRNCQAAVIANPDNATVEIILHGGEQNDRVDLYKDLRNDLIKHYVGQKPTLEETPWAVAHGIMQDLTEQDQASVETRSASRSASDLISFAEIATLVGVGEKRVRNVVAEWRGTGHTITDPCSYATIRALLVETWPKKCALFGTFDDVRRSLDARKRR